MPKGGDRLGRTSCTGAFVDIKRKVPRLRSAAPHFARDDRVGELPRPVAKSVLWLRSGQAKDGGPAFS